MWQLPLAQSHTSGRWERDIAGNRMWVSSAPPLTIAPEVLPGAGGGGSRSEGGAKEERFGRGSRVVVEHCWVLC